MSAVLPLSELLGKQKQFYRSYNRLAFKKRIKNCVYFITNTMFYQNQEELGYVYFLPNHQ